MPRAIVAPTSTLILSDEEAARRLGGIAPDSVHDDVEEASRTLADDLGYPVAYGTWEDDLSPATGRTLALPHLGAFEIVSVTPRGGQPLSGDSYALQPSSGLIERAGAWGGFGWWPTSLLQVSSGAPDYWTVRYRGGWWLETMTGQRPADVPELPTSLRRAFLELLRDMYFGAKISPHWRSTSNEGASVTFNTPGGSEALTRYHDLIRPYKLLC